MTIIKSNPHRAVKFSESGIKKALERAGSLDVEIKYDGVRVNLMVEPQDCGEHLADAWFQTRESKPLASLDYLWQDYKARDRWDWFLYKAGWPGGLMIDGEAMVKGVDFNTSSGILRTKWLKDSNKKYDTRSLLDWDKKLWGTKTPFRLVPARLQVVIYAMLPMDIVKSGAEGPSHALTRMRTEALVPMLQEHFPEIDWVLSHSTTVYDMDELNTLYQAAREDKQEGLIVLDPLGNYKRGKKSGMWKMKPDEDIDGVVVGLNWGTEGLANEGKVIGFDVLLENGMVVAANNISQKLMDEFTGNILTDSGHTTMSEYLQNRSDAGYYEGYQVEVSYMEMTPDGSLRHPSFKCFRGTEDNPKVKS